MVAIQVQDIKLKIKRKADMYFLLSHAQHLINETNEIKM